MSCRLVRPPFPSRMVYAAGVASFCFGFGVAFGLAARSAYLSQIKSANLFMLKASVEDKVTVEVSLAGGGQAGLKALDFCSGVVQLVFLVW